MHGLWLSASNALKALNTIQEAKISIEAVYLDCDALWQVVGLGYTYKVDNKRINQIKNHQAPSQSITLVAMKALCQHTKFKEQHTTLPAYKDSLTEISKKDLPTV